MNFNLRKTASGRRHYFYFELWALIQPTEKLLVGHEESRKFTRGSFLILPESEIVQEFLIAGQSERRRSEVRALIENDPEFCAALKRLMHQKFCHMTLGKEIHVGGPFLLKRVTVLRYITVPVEKATEETLRPWKRDLEFVARKMGITQALIQ